MTKIIKNLKHKQKMETINYIQIVQWILGLKREAFNVRIYQATQNLDMDSAKDSSDSTHFVYAK